MSTLGSNIRKIRTENNLTLNELSQKTDLSISFLSQLERGKSSATLESLKKISLALGTNPSYFFDDADMHQTENVNFEKRELQSERILYENLNKRLSNPAFSPLMITLKPGDNEGDLFTHKGQEFLYVIEGELTVQIEDEKYVLNKGASIMLDSNIKHYWYNYTQDDVKFLCIAYDQ